MTYIFDTLGYAKRLKAAGISGKAAEAHAMAIKDHVMADLVTKEDLRLALDLQNLRLTVRLGGIVVTAMGILVAIVKVLS